MFVFAVVAGGWLLVRGHAPTVVGKCGRGAVEEAAVEAKIDEVVLGEPLGEIFERELVVGLELGFVGEFVGAEVEQGGD